MAERYDYEMAVRDDVRDYINDHFTTSQIREALLEDRDGFQEQLYDDMWVADSVTGNASGSYTFNAWKAEENVCHNLDLLGEAVETFGSDMDVLKSGAESCDVTIRCYLLGEAISYVLDEMEEELL